MQGTTWLCTTSVQITTGRATYLHSTESNMHQIYPFHGECAQISFIVCVADSKFSVFFFAFSMKSCTWNPWWQDARRCEAPNPWVPKF